MSKIKYIPAEIDGVNVFDRIERNLAAGDVTRGEHNSGSGITVENTLVNHEQRITFLEQSGVDPIGVDSILVSSINWQVLVDFNGNVLTTGVN